MKANIIGNRKVQEIKQIGGGNDDHKGYKITARTL